jgi:hypothetical protein
VANLIAWCQSDPFWQGNILCPEKLRKQYDQLVIKMGGNIKQATTSGQSAASETKQMIERMKAEAAL